MEMETVLAQIRYLPAKFRIEICDVGSDAVLELELEFYIVAFCGNLNVFSIIFVQVCFWNDNIWRSEICYFV